MTEKPNNAKTSPPGGFFFCLEICSLKGETKVQTVFLKPWTFTYSSQEVRVLPNVKEVLEDFINKQYLSSVKEELSGSWLNYSIRQWGIPSPVIRIDMDPVEFYESGVTLPICKIDANPLYLGVVNECFQRLGIIEAIHRALRALGVEKIGYAATPSQHEWRYDLQNFMRTLMNFGIGTEHVDLRESMDPSLPLWIYGGRKDAEILDPLMGRCLSYPYRERGCDDRRNMNDENFARDGKWLHIWRIFAVWNGTKYFIVGGFWSRYPNPIKTGPSLPVFGALSLHE